MKECWWMNKANILQAQNLCCWPKRYEAAMSSNANIFYCFSRNLAHGDCLRNFGQKQWKWPLYFFSSLLKTSQFVSLCVSTSNGSTRWIPEHRVIYMFIRAIVIWYFLTSLLFFTPYLPLIVDFISYCFTTDLRFVSWQRGGVERLQASFINSPVCCQVHELAGVFSDDDILSVLSTLLRSSPHFIALLSCHDCIANKVCLGCWSASSRSDGKVSWFKSLSCFVVQDELLTGSGLLSPCKKVFSMSLLRLC